VRELLLVPVLTVAHRTVCSALLVARGVSVCLWLPLGAVCGRVSAAAPVRPACAGLSLGRLAPGHSHLSARCHESVYLSIAIPSRVNTILCALALRRRPAVTLSSVRTSLEQRSLSPGVIAPLSLFAVDQFAAAGAPSRSPPSSP
jgi:hypothetical protein